MFSAVFRHQRVALQHLRSHQFSTKITKKWNIERNELFDELNLKYFTSNELIESYRRYLSKETDVTAGDVNNKDILTKEDNNQTESNEKSFGDVKIGSAGGPGVWNEEILKEIIRNILNKKGYVFNSSGNIAEYEQLTARMLKDLQFNEKKELTEEQYLQNIQTLAKKFDSRVLPIAFSFLLTGLSIGIIVPCMPILVNEIQLTSTQFGITISSFGFSKLLGNIPATHLVNTLGRKPLMTVGLGMTAIGIAGYGTSLSPGYGFPIILACRLFTGLGVSGITTGGQMYLSDISTALNRVQTMNPVMMSFQAGMSLGPAIGGILIDSVGIATTYYTVGGLVFSVALLNHFILSETKPTPPPVVDPTIPPQTMKNSLKIALVTWKKLIHSSPVIRETLFMNGMYWVVLSGTQFAMLPLIMVNPILHMSVSQIGMAYAAMSLFSAAVSQPLSYLADRYDKKYIMLTGCTLVSAATASLPFVTNSTELIAVLLPLSLGSAMMQNIPSALILNTCDGGEDKAQGLSLLRTIGDLGFIVGGTMSGLIAAYTSIDTAIYVQSSLLLSTVAIVAGSKHLKIFQ